MRAIPTLHVLIRISVATASECERYSTHYPAIAIPSFERKLLTVSAICPSAVLPTCPLSVQVEAREIPGGMFGFQERADHGRGFQRRG